MIGADPTTGRTATWVSFAGWSVLGILFALGFVTVGWLLLAPAILVGIAFAFDKTSRRGIYGFAVGAGICIVALAFLLRDDHLRISAFVMGASLVLIGLLGHVRRILGQAEAP
jgi:bacteriorhodopsin